MLPIILDISNLSVAVVGSGPQARRRLQMVDAANTNEGAGSVRVFAVDAAADMRMLAADRLVENWPTEADIAACQMVYVANIDPILAEKITTLGRRHKTLVNVEDVKPLCDFHVPAMIRRGDMLLTASTGGRSPGLAQRLKKKLEAQYPESWAARLDALATRREGWLVQGVGFGELSERTSQMIDEEGWLT